MNHFDKHITVRSARLGSTFTTPSAASLIEVKISGSPNHSDDTHVVMDCYTFTRKPSSLIGKGRITEVYRGEHQFTGQAVAVEVWDKRRLGDNRDLSDFVSSLDHVNHTNIVSLLHAYESKSFYYFVMEFCNGSDLQQYMRMKKRLNEKSIRSFIAQIRQAMQALGDRGITHGKLCPRKILLVYDETKFKNIHQADPQTIILKITCLYASKHVVGNNIPGLSQLLYAAPESLFGKECNEKSDLFSMGVILYECLMGRRPYPGSCFPDLAKSDSNSKINIPFPAETSRQFDEFLWKLLQRDPNNRMSFDEFMHHPGGNREPAKPFVLPVNMTGAKVLNADKPGLEIIIRNADFCHVSQYDVSFASMQHEEKWKFLFLNGYQSDITFVVMNGNVIRKFPAHMSILQSECPNLSLSFAEITFENYSVSSFVTVLRFIYTRELVIDLNVSDILYDVLSLAHKLGKKSVRDRIHMCTDEDLNPFRWQLLRYAHDFDDLAMAKNCMEYLDKQGSSMLQSDDFIRLPVDLLAEMTARSSFQCEEFPLFQACFFWAKKHDNASDDRSCLIREKMDPLIRNIRFPCMRKQQIREIEELKILTDSELLDIYKTFLFTDHKSQFRCDAREIREEPNETDAAMDKKILNNHAGLRYKEIEI